MNVEALLDFRLICEQLPIGLFVLNRDDRISYWNDWLADKSGITPAQALGRRLEDLYPGWRNERFQWAVEQAIDYNIPHVLSQALNRLLLPIKVPLSERHGVALMQQKVSVMPLPGGDSGHALVIIQDVTDTVVRAQAANDVMQRFREVSLRDPLTNLFNRRFMWEWLAQELKSADRNNAPLACLMLDIDHFKPLNDSLGHQRGDEILQGFVASVATQLRESDILVRYGGEEFAAFLPRCTLRHAIITAQRIRQQVRGQAIAGLTPGQVTCSIGVALYDPQLPGTGAEELLREADRCLYEAKHKGRDRVCPATEGEACDGDDDYN
jgi:diguanylate cyclase (GGDEF)-like protein